ncbi:unnamed protein product [Cuscuta europaea]|uniref:F-box domain-containing protein n=1 Tax=Cuscuta europaea TaxID=41803 RepID=A0A9P1E4Z9_CUSEU|nr:unnamed protein product [Cuscuta europaea]
MSGEIAPEFMEDESDTDSGEEMNEDEEFFFEQEEMEVAGRGEDEDDTSDDTSDEDTSDDEEFREERNGETNEQKVSVDRISGLPDGLLASILSHLDTKESMVTSVLSKRWRYLWMLVTKLKFSEESLEIEKIRKFVAGINRILVVFNAQYVVNFEVELTYYECFAADLFVWVVYALKSDVFKFSLLLNPSPSKDLYKLPNLIFDYPHLKDLWLRRCILAPLTVVDWPSLRRLYLEDIELPQDVLDKIIAGCPLLYKCLLSSCWGFSRFEANIQKFTLLGIGDSEDGNKDPLLEISAPLAQTLVLTPYLQGRKWRITNISSAVKATIDLVGSDWDPSCDEIMSNTKDFLDNLQHVNKLNLGRDIMQVISMIALNSWELSHSTRRCLEVNVSCNDLDIDGIICLLESSPNLETLVIDGYRPKKNSPCFDPELVITYDLRSELLNLKSIEITIWPDPNFQGEPMMKLVQLLLKGCSVLEKMVVNVVGTDDIVSVIQNLLAYPRSSPNAVIYVP